MNFSQYVKRRAFGDRFLALGILLAVFLASTVMAGGPIYLRSLEKIGMAEVTEKLGRHNKNIGLISDWIPLEANEIAFADSVIDKSIDSRLESMIIGRSTRIKSLAHYWGVEDDDPETVTITQRGPLASEAYFHEIEGLFDVVTYVEGRAPSQQIIEDSDGNLIIEVSVFLKRSKNIRHGDRFDDINVGDIIAASSVLRTSGVVKGKVVGIFDIDNPNDDFWLGDSSSILEPKPPQLFGGADLPIVLFTDEGIIASGVGPSNAGLPTSYTRILFTDSEELAKAKSGELVELMDRFEAAAAKKLPRSRALLGARSAIRAMDQKMLFLRLPALLLAALAVALVGYYLFMVAGMLARKRELEIILLRSRGFSTFQAMKVQIIESVFVIGLPAVISPFLAYFIVGFAGRLSVFESLTEGQNLPVEISLSAWIWTAIVAIISFAIVFVPTLLVARTGISNIDQQRARPERPPIFQRFYVDVLIIALGGFFLWEVSSRGVTVSDRDGQITTDPTLLFAPGMLLLSVALLVLRAFPVLMRVLGWVVMRFTSASSAVGFWRLARSPYWYAWPVLLIILGVGLGVMVGTLGSTLERSDREQIFYDNGTSLRLLPRGVHADILQADIETLGLVEGVNKATKALRKKAKIGTTDLGTEFTALAIDAANFPDIAWFRDDFAQRPINELFSYLDFPSKPEPLILPKGTTELSVWTKQDPYVHNHFFWVVISDSEGRQIPVTFGQIGDEWEYKTTKIPDHFVDPIEIVSLQTFMQASADGGSPTTWWMDDLVAISPDTEVTLLDFDNNSLWTPFPTSNGLDDSFQDVPEPQGIGESGSGVGQMILERGTVAGVRGVYRSSNGDPVPVIVSDNFLSLTGGVIGEPLVVQIAGGFIPVLPVGSTSLFPTLDPTRRPFMVLDVDTLLDFVDLRGLSNISANEVFLDIDDANHAETTERVRNLFKGSVLKDRAARIENSVIDPLTVAGWRGMGIVSLLIGGTVLVFGYVTYMVTHSIRTIHDSAYLRAMGLSNRGFMNSSAIEHGIVAAVAIFIGVITGLVASRVAVGALAYSETGRALLPPFILQTNWWPVVVMLLITGSAGLIGVVAAFLGFLRRPLHELTRSSE